MKEDLIKIIEYGVLAPSGDNAQPWRFKVREGQIFLYNVPERDESIYNYHQMASYIAHGALLENLKIAASHFGYSTDIKLFPNAGDVNIVAIVSLEKTNISTDPLFSVLEKRCTNRKPYNNQKPSKDQLDKIINSSHEVNFGEVRVKTDESDVKLLAKALSTNEKIVLETKEMHHFLFSHVTWTDQEQAEKRIGMDIKTLELKGPEPIAFRILRYWPIMKILSYLGIGSVVAKSNEKNYAASAAIGIILTKNDSKEDFVRSGMLMERVWLNAASSGLSMQLLTGIAFLENKIRKGDNEPFSASQVKAIKNAYETFRDTFSMANENAVLLFRLGFDGEPNGKCLRLAPEISFE